MATTYTKQQLTKKSLPTLDTIAEELGIDYHEVFGVKNPKKALVIEQILKAQEALAVEEEGKTNTNPPIHRTDLSHQEKEDFRAWTRRNYEPGQPIDPTWHPVVQEECAEINAMDGISKTNSKKGRSRSAAKTETPSTDKFDKKVVSDLKKGEEFMFEGQKKLYKTTKVYKDDKDRPHVVVRTDTPTKGQPEEMDLYYKNHMSMAVYAIAK